MDILKRYEEQNPQAPADVPRWEPSKEYGGLTRFLVRLSGGKIQNEKQANTMLAALTICLFIITLIVLFGAGGESPAAFTPKGYFFPLPGAPQKNK